MITASHRKAFDYHLWGHRLASDFDLGELELCGDGCGAGNLIRIRRSPEGSWPGRECESVFEDPFENGDPWFTSWKTEDGYIVGFPECSFHLQPREMRIECDPVAGVAESTIAHLILDHAIPRLLSLTAGFVVFHASAVQIGNRVVAILGKSGQGKSTLASWFAAQDFPLLTDDCLVVRWDEAQGQWLAQPSYHSVRLWPDSVDALGIAKSKLREFAGYSAKRRTGREVDFRFASGGAPLTACFVLPGSAGPGANGAAATEAVEAHSGPPELHTLSVNEAFVALAGAVFRIDPGDPEINRREFEVLTSLTSTVRFWSLHYEREYRWLPAVQEAMIEAVRADD